MNTLTKLALGLMGTLHAQPALDEGAPAIEVPASRTGAGKPLMQALRRRQSQRDLAPQPLPRAMSDLLWAAAGIKRPKLGGRTAPSTLNAPEVSLHVALPEGLYLHEPAAHLLLAQTAGRRRRTARGGASGQAA